MADKKILKSSKLAHVLYDIRGPIMDKARQMEAEGKKLIKLNIGNLAVFGFDPPEEVMSDMITNLPNSAGYSDSKGIFAARKAVMHYTQLKGIEGVTLDDIYLGNGASDLISMATEALLNEGDELLVPMPDYPLWTAVTSLAGATPVHYLCDESKGWIPSIEDIRAKVTPRTKGIVIINPNNPTGVMYPNDVLLEIIQIARENNLVILADEVYDKILYDGIKHTAIGRTDVEFQFAFQSLPRLRLPRGLDGDFRQQIQRQRLHRRAQYARQHEALRERSRSVGDSDRVGRLSVHQRFGGRRRAVASAA